MPIPNPSLDKIIDWALKHNKWIVPGSFYEKDHGKIYNTSVVISPDGELVARYRKIFPWHPLEASEPGGEFCIFDIPQKGRFGLCICYDMWFPELTRSLAWMGAEAVFCPTATYTSDRVQERIMAQANAISNQLYLFNVNGLGVGGIGQSIFVDPEGRILQTSGGTELMMTEIIDLDHVWRVREYGTLGLCQVWKALANFNGKFPAYQEDFLKGEIYKSIGPMKLHKKNWQLIKRKEKIMKKWLLIVLLVTLAVLPSGVSASAGSPDTLVYAAYGDIKDWDPSVAFSLEVVMLVNVYEPLVYYNPPGSEEQLRPGLATSWEKSEDGLTWTFHLRQGVKFHDGEPFNAAAVKYSIDRTMKMKKGAYYIWLAVKEIKVVDDYTVQFLLKEPAPIDLIASSQYGAYIFSPKAAEKGTEWFMQGNAAGTGPYEVDSWEKSQQVVLTKFDDYWGGWQGQHFNRVVIKVVLEKSTQVQMIKSGEADFASLAPVDALPALRKSPGVEVITPKSWKNSMFLINTQKFPTDNLKVRQALCYVWDYNAVVNSIYNGLATVAEGPVPKTMWGHNPNLPKYEFNLKKAAQLIQESGIPKDKLQLTLAYIGTSQEYENCAQLLQANLAKIGVQLELLPGPWGTIWEKAKNLETAPNLQSMTWWPTYPTPNDWLIGMFKTEKKALFNLSHYSNPQVDALLDEGVKMEGVDRDAAINAYQEAQRIIVEDAAAVFYADIATRIVKRASVKGLVDNPAYGAWFYYQLYRE